MKLVASAKLRKAQYLIENYRPYSEALREILQSTLAHLPEAENILTQSVPKPTRFAVLVFASNSSLCGAFNHNIMHQLDQTLGLPEYQQAESILLYGFGKKINQHIQRQWMSAPQKENRIRWEEHNDWPDRPNFEAVSSLADHLLQKAKKGELHRVIALYTHFKNRGVQIPQNEILLPISIPKSNAKHRANYIFEPNAEQLLQQLLPATMKSRIFSILLDSGASEHAARANAMQAANENADQIIEELRVQYNRVRQEVITAEILDIIGGAEAIHKSR